MQEAALQRGTWGLPAAKETRRGPVTAWGRPWELRPLLMRGDALHCVCGEA